MNILLPINLRLLYSTSWVHVFNHQSDQRELAVTGLTKIDLNLDTFAGGDDKMPLWAKLGKLLTMKPIRTIMKPGD